MPSTALSTSKRKMPVGKPFQPGQSGNAGGRPKVIVEVQALARTYTKAAITALADIVENGESESARVAAAEAILNRGWGKPVQPIDGDGEGGPIPVAIIVRAVAAGVTG